MSFDRRDIRRKMDVYTLDGAYLGSVLRVIDTGIDAADRSAIHAVARQTGRGAIGERLGPAPTQTIGNSGPLTQVEERRYTSQSDGSAHLRDATIVVGKYWGLTGRRSIPLSAVQTVSMERVVLHYTLQEMAASGSDFGSAQR